MWGGGITAIYIGAHKPFSENLTKGIDRFCELYDAPIFCDLTSGYQGKYRVCASILALQEGYENKAFSPDTLIYIGEGAGEYEVYGQLSKAKRVWRVSEDGLLTDTWRNLTDVFEMDEEYFFRCYNVAASENASITPVRSTADKLNEIIRDLRSNVPELPFSNLWISRRISEISFQNISFVFGVSITLRSFSIFPPEGVDITTWANVGARGIDGTLSAAIGSALAKPDRTCFCVLGDLSFFYNMNALGNRQLPENLRILVVNNGCGAEFKRYNHRGSQMLREEEDVYVAEAGHFGNKSDTFVRSLAESLGIRYLCAHNKDEAGECLIDFLSSGHTNQPIIFEAFTESEDESQAFKLVATSLYGYLNPKLVNDNPNAIIMSDKYEGCGTQPLFMADTRIVTERFIAHTGFLNAIYIRPVTWENEYEDNEFLNMVLKEQDNTEVWAEKIKLSDMPNNRWFCVPVKGITLATGQPYELEFSLSFETEKADYFQLLTTDHYRDENGYAVIAGEKKDWTLCIVLSKK